MLIHKPHDVLPSEITARSLFERRREFLARSGAGLIAGTALWHGLPADARAAAKLQTAPSALSTTCLLYTSPSPRDRTRSRMPSSA